MEGESGVVKLLEKSSRDRKAAFVGASRDASTDASTDAASRNSTATPFERKCADQGEMIFSDIPENPKLIYALTAAAAAAANDSISSSSSSLSSSKTLWTVENLRAICKMDAEIAEKYPGLNGRCQYHSLPLQILELSEGGGGGGGGGGEGGIGGKSKLGERLTEEMLASTIAKLRACSKAYQVQDLREESGNVRDVWSLG